jgi:hypothetical protein
LFASATSWRKCAQVVKVVIVVKVVNVVNVVKVVKVVNVVRRANVVKVVNVVNVVNVVTTYIYWRMVSLLRIINKLLSVGAAIPNEKSAFVHKVVMTTCTEH